MALLPESRISSLNDWADVYELYYPGTDRVVWLIADKNASDKDQRRIWVKLSAKLGLPPRPAQSQPTNQPKAGQPQIPH